VRYEPWNMDGTTVLEHFMSTDRRIQYVICGQAHTICYLRPGRRQL
jgi:hypothetical protein